MHSVFSKNGKILPISEATVSVFNVNYSYGFGVYENVRVKSNKALFLGDHLQRLFNSAKIIGLENLYNEVKISKWIDELIKYLGGEDKKFPIAGGQRGVLAKKEAVTCNLKILLIGGNTPKENELYILPLAPLFPDKKLYSIGANVCAVNHKRWNPQAKTLNMLPSYLAYREAKNKNCYDALFVDNDDCIREGTRTNFFTIKNKTIFTPPESKILAGVTRAKVLNVAAKNGYTIKETDIKIGDLANYDGAFITSTSSKIVPLKKINNFEYKQIPEELKNLIKLFNYYLDSV